VYARNRKSLAGNRPAAAARVADVSRVTNASRHSCFFPSPSLLNFKGNAWKMALISIKSSPSKVYLN
jgi:hypothetical protein